MKSVMFFVILMLTLQANCQEAPEITASGDGAEKPSMTTEFMMIDDNGELVGNTEIPATAITVETEDAEANLNDTHTTVFSVTDETTADFMVSTTVSDTETTTNIPTTTTTSTTTVSTTTTGIPTTTTETTTTEASTTTLAPTTTTTETTTEATTQKPTTFTTSSPTTKIMPPKSTTILSTAQLPTVGTTFVPNPEAKHCAFMDPSLVCNMELVCYGEGEIDCTEEADAVPLETTSMNKIALTSVAEDYSDFDGSEATIGTFPPDLIGVVSPKNKFPHLFKMGALGTTDEGSDASTETTGEPSTTAVFTLATTQGVLKDQTTVKSMADEPVLDAEEDIVTGTLLTVLTTDKSTEAPVSTSTPTKMTTEVAMAEETVSSIVSVTEGVVTTAEYVLSQMNFTTVQPAEDATTTEGAPETEQPGLLRRKREDTIITSGSESASPSMSESLHVASLEASQRKNRMKTCKVSGNLLCTPQPTLAMCKGKSYCQVIGGTAETSEKSTSAKGVENWAIAVIAICAIAAALTISLLFYLVITSWKKLKVQPQNGVTTLTYVNNTPP